MALRAAAQHIGLGLVVSLLAAVPAQAAPTVRDLGTLGGDTTRPSAINSAGHVVGESTTAGNAATRAFLWRGGKLRDLGTMGGPNSTAADINDRGQITGTSDVVIPPTEGDPVPATRRAFLWEDGTFRDLGEVVDCFGRGDVEPPDSEEDTSGVAINEGGQIVGRYESCSGGADTAYSFLWDGTFRQIAGDSWIARELNDAGVVVGTGFPYPRAVVWTAGPPPSEQPLPGFETVMYSTAADINNAGTIVGTYQVADNWPTHGYRYDADTGRVTPLGSLGGDSTPRAINDRGWIVGTSQTAAGESRAFLARPGGAMIDLNSVLRRRSCWVLEDAVDVNDRGQIVGTGTCDGRTRAYVLSP